MKSEFSRKKSALINLFVSFGSQILIILLNFISRTFFLKYLSAEYLGINGLFTNILTVLSLAELGIGEAMIFAMYKPMRNNDELQLSKLLNFYRQAYRLIAVAVAVLGIILSFFLETFVESIPDINENFQIIFLLYLANTVASYLLTYKRSLLLADQKRYTVVAIQSTFSIIQVVLQIILLAVFKAFLLYLLVQIVCLILGNIFISLYANKNYSKVIANNKAQLSKKERKNIFNNIKALSITRIAGVIGSGTDNLIISKMIGLTTVGLVSNYTLIVNAINGLLWSILNGIVNTIGDFNVDSTVERRRTIFDQLYLGSYMLFTFVGVCIVSLINPFISIWLGEEYVLNSVLAFSLVLSIFIGGINFAAYSFRISLGYFKQVQWYYVAYAVLNIILSIFLGKYYGAIGIFLATSISRLITAEVADGYYVFKCGLKRNPIKYYLRDIFSIFTFSGLCFLVTQITSLITCGGILGFIMQCLIAIVVTTILLLLICFKQKGFQELFNYFIKTIKRK